MAKYFEGREITRGKMKFMKIGTRPDIFYTEEATRYKVLLLPLSIFFFFDITNNISSDYAGQWSQIYQATFV